MLCDFCLAAAPTRKKRLYKISGMIILYQIGTFEGEYCSNCMRKHSVERNIYNFFVGWWGFPAALVNLFAIIWNIVVFFQSYSLAPPPAGAAPVNLTDQDVEVLEQYVACIVEHHQSGQTLENIAYSIAQDSKHTAPQVMLYIRSLISANPDLFKKSK